MDDREILEYAAKAYADPNVSVEHGEGRRWIGVNEELGCDVFVAWNPLVDDGDALRLAFKLKLTMAFRGNCFGVWNTNKPMGCSDICEEGDLSDFRRRIVSVAAEIVKDMP